MHNFGLQKRPEKQSSAAPSPDRQPSLHRLSTAFSTVTTQNSRRTVDFTLRICDSVFFCVSRRDHRPSARPAADIALPKRPAHNRRSEV